MLVQAVVALVVLQHQLLKVLQSKVTCYSMCLTASVAVDACAVCCSAGSPSAPAPQSPAVESNMLLGVLLMAFVGP
jgi:hypothetical protein